MRADNAVQVEHRIVRTLPFHLSVQAEKTFEPFMLFSGIGREEIDPFHGLEQGSQSEMRDEGQAHVGILFQKFPNHRDAHRYVSEGRKPYDQQMFHHLACLV